MFEEVYIVAKRNVLKVEIVYDKEGNEYIYGYDKHIKLDRSKCFDNMLDARYESFLYQMRNGSKLSNFKSTKYFKYYVQRAQEENPEYII